MLAALAYYLWMVVPIFRPGKIGFHLYDFLLPVAFGLGWMGLFARSLVRRPLLPLNDPRLADAAPHH
jgi:hypothetical protein